MRRQPTGKCAVTGFLTIFNKVLLPSFSVLRIFISWSSCTVYIYNRVSD